jgi:hypothetical protein
MHILNFPGFTTVTKLDTHGVGVDNTGFIRDKILIYGEGDTEEEAIADHDVKFRTLMERCKEQNLKLNKDKLSRKHHFVKQNVGS